MKRIIVLLISAILAIVPMFAIGGGATAANNDVTIGKGNGVSARVDNIDEFSDFLRWYTQQSEAATQPTGIALTNFMAKQPNRGKSVAAMPVEEHTSNDTYKNVTVQTSGSSNVQYAFNMVYDSKTAFLGTGNVKCDFTQTAAYMQNAYYVKCTEKLSSNGEISMPDFSSPGMVYFDLDADMYGVGDKCYIRYNKTDYYIAPSTYELSWSLSKIYKYWEGKWIDAAGLATILGANPEQSTGQLAFFYQYLLNKTEYFINNNGIYTLKKDAVQDMSEEYFNYYLTTLDMDVAEVVGSVAEYAKEREWTVDADYTLNLRNTVHPIENVETKIETKFSTSDDSGSFAYSDSFKSYEKYHSEFYNINNTVIHAPTDMKIYTFMDVVTGAFTKSEYDAVNGKGAYDVLYEICEEVYKVIFQADADDSSVSGEE